MVIRQFSKQPSAVLSIRNKTGLPEVIFKLLRSPNLPSTLWPHPLPSRWRKSHQPGSGSNAKI